MSHAITRDSNESEILTRYVSQFVLRESALHIMILVFLKSNQQLSPKCGTSNRTNL